MSEGRIDDVEQDGNNTEAAVIESEDTSLTTKLARRRLIEEMMDKKRFSDEEAW